MVLISEGENHTPLRGEIPDSFQEAQAKAMSSVADCIYQKRKPDKATDRNSA